MNGPIPYQRFVATHFADESPSVVPFWITASKQGARYGQVVLPCLLEAYLNRGCEVRHHQFSRISPCTKVEDQTEHCERVAREVHEALSFDFHGAPLPLPSLQEVYNKATVLFKEFYDQKTEQLALLLLDTVLREHFLLGTPPAELPHWHTLLSKILTVVKIRFPYHDDYVAAHHALLEQSVRRQLQVLQVKLHLKANIDTLALYAHRAPEVPNSQDLFEWVCEDCPQNFEPLLSQEEYDDVRYTLLAYIEDQLTSLKFSTTTLPLPGIPLQ